MITSRILEYSSHLARCYVRRSLHSAHSSCIGRCVRASPALIHRRFFCVKPCALDQNQIDSAGLAIDERTNGIRFSDVQHGEDAQGKGTVPDSYEIQTLLRDIDQFARQGCGGNDGSTCDLAFFDEWWNKLYHQIQNASSRQICLMIGALGLINWKTQEGLRRDDLLTRSQIHCLETHLLLGDYEKLDSRFHATLYLGLQRLYEYDNYGSLPYPADQLVSGTLQYFANNANRSDPHTKSALAQFAWSLSQMKTCPVDEEFKVLTSLLHELVVDNKNILESFSTGDANRRLALGDLISICAQQIQIATSYLEWRTDPSEAVTVTEAESDTKPVGFWHDWHSVTNFVLDIYLTDSIDWTEKKDEMSFDVNTLIALLCYDCLELATEFDLLSELFACEHLIAQMLVKCTTADSATFSSEVILALERAIDNVTTKCKAKAIIMGIDKDKIPTCPVLSTNQLAAKTADIAQTIREKVAQHTARAFQSETLYTPYVLKRFYLTIGASVDHLFDVLRQRKDLHSYVHLTTPAEGDELTSVNDSMRGQSESRNAKGSSGSASSQSELEKQEWADEDSKHESSEIQDGETSSSNTVVDADIFKKMLVQHSKKTPRRDR